MGWDGPVTVTVPLPVPGRSRARSLGLELDELPVLAPGFDAPLQAGQTVAVEPKFVFPGVGAVGIENSYVVTDGGGERLTTGAPDEILRAPAA